MHDCLVAYRQMEEAEQFRGIMQSKFPDNARIQEYLGLSLARLGRTSESEQHMLKAYELRPDLPNARAFVARRRMREGKLDEARQLLDFLEKPGAVQVYSLGALEELADGYAAQHRNREALELYHHLLKEIPDLGQQREFRAKVERTEQSVGGVPTALRRRSCLRGAAVAVEG
jgi:tetratricopeptide (TPR) repeat protein